MHLSIEAPFAVLSFGAPESLNAMEDSNLDLFPSLVEEAERSRDVKLLIVSGDDKWFCTGGSPEYLLSVSRLGKGDRIVQLSRGQKWITSLIRSELFTVAYVNGLAAGAGFDLLFAFDKISTGPNAKFNSMFPSLGAIPDLGGFHLLSQMVGRSVALDVYSRSKDIPFDYLREIGGVNLDSQVVENLSQLKKRLKRDYALHRHVVRFLKSEWFENNIKRLGEHQHACALAQAEIIADGYFIERMSKVARLQSVFGRKTE